MAAKDVLPINATQLELDLADATSLESNGFNDLSKDLFSFKYQNIPNSVIPWLIIEYGLSPVTRYLTDPKEALDRGVEWNRIKGTPKSLKLALGWIQFTPEGINENRFRPFTFEINTGKVPETRELIKNIVELSNLSKPVRAKLNRLYFGLDLKPFTLNDPEAGLNKGVLSNFSGIYDEDNKVWLSFLTQTTEGEDLSVLLDLDLTLTEHTLITTHEGYNFQNNLQDYLCGSIQLFCILGEGTFTITGEAGFLSDQISTDAIAPDMIVTEVTFILGEL